MNAIELFNRMMFLTSKKVELMSQSFSLEDELASKERQLNETKMLLMEEISSRKDEGGKQLFSNDQKRQIEFNRVISLDQTNDYTILKERCEEIRKMKQKLSIEYTSIDMEFSALKSYSRMILGEK